MPRISAGLLVYRRRGDVSEALEVLLAHPGGPFFRNKDAGAWTIPKGELEENEDPLAAARREFAEEIGPAPPGPFLMLTSVKQRGGKVVHAWACEGDCDVENLRSNTFTIEWPPRSGRMVDFPEVDQAEYFPLETAREKINPAQVALLDELFERLSGAGNP